ncbi:hypothetical protein CsSME_00051942 [Camellia sinensis var. sinensis]
MTEQEGAKTLKSLRRNNIKIYLFPTSCAWFSFVPLSLSLSLSLYLSVVFHKQHTTTSFASRPLSQSPLLCSLKDLAKNDVFDGTKRNLGIVELSWLAISCFFARDLNYMESAKERQGWIEEESKTNGPFLQKFRLYETRAGVEKPFPSNPDKSI